MVRTARSVAVILAITVLVFEGLARGYALYREIGSGDAPVPLAIFDPLGRPMAGSIVPVKKNYRQFVRSPEYEVDVVLDENGFRSPRGVDLARLELAFLGDSFTFG